MCYAMEATVLNAKPLETNVSLHWKNAFMFKTTQNRGQTPSPTVKYETFLYFKKRLANLLQSSSEAASLGSFG